jgi:hypothetical protein
VAAIRIIGADSLIFAVPKPDRSIEHGDAIYRFRQITASAVPASAIAALFTLSKMPVNSTGERGN